MKEFNNKTITKSSNSEFLIGIKATISVFSTMTSLSLNVGNFVTLKLTPSNYPLWREQVLSLAESQDLIHHLIKETPIPEKFTTTKSNTTTNDNTSTTLTKAFIDWRKSDRLLRSWIIRTLFKEALGLVVGLDTTSAVWNALKEAYA